MRTQLQTCFSLAESTSSTRTLSIRSGQWHRKRHACLASMRRAKTQEKAFPTPSTTRILSRSAYGAPSPLQCQHVLHISKRYRVCLPKLCASNDDDAQTARDGKSEAAGIFDLSILATTKFDVPWGGKVLATGFASWAFLFLGIGLIVAPSAADFLHINFTDSSSPSDKAYFLLLDQTFELVAGLGLIWLVTKPFSPLPEDLFQFSFQNPMNRRDGWLLWALIGIVGGFAGVGVTSYLLSLLQTGDGPQAMGTADAVVSILSKDPKVFLSLLTVTSVMAPLLEEVIFRGFLLTTLTKWLPAPTAAFVSAGLFGAAHLTSKDFAQLTALGVVLGLTYIRTKNLATPILIHSFWNSGVLCVLEILYLGGYDVKELLK